MSTDIKVPQLPESVSDATLVAWHKKPGDGVKRDENLVDIETDKVVLEVPAPADGVLGEIKVEEGTTVSAGDVIGSIEAGGTGAEDADKDEDKAKDKKEKDGDEDAQAGGKAASGKQADDGEEERGKEREEEQEEEQEEASGGSADSPKLSPSVRRLVEEHDLEPAKIKATGRGGRLTKSDVQAHLDDAGDDAEGEGTAAESGQAAPAVGAREDRRVPMTRMRARIAERMVEAQSTAAMLTSFNEADMSAIMALRKQYKDSFEKAHGIKLGFMSFFIKAACEALKRYPAVNASVDGKDIVYHDYYDIGVAVSVPRGLVVPIVRDADQKSFAEIEQAIAELAGKGRDGTLSMDDLTGGTFTITNGGVFGSLVSTPILNMPQSAILGMHKIQERPVVVDGEIVARPMMYLALTYDHRIIDGKDAVQFLVAIKDALEDPSRMLIQV